MSLICRRHNRFEGQNHVDLGLVERREKYLDLDVVGERDTQNDVPSCERRKKSEYGVQPVYYAMLKEFGEQQAHEEGVTLQTIHNGK